jgi:YD repeat-containing protein
VRSSSGGRSVTDYSYDAVGNLLKAANGEGAVSYTYDALNRLTGLVNPQGVTLNFKYDAAGRRVKKSVFKSAPVLLAETDYAYDAAGQLLGITNKAGGKVVAFNNYEYDLAGNRVLKKDQDGVTKYG